MDGIYLDYNATTPLLPEVAQAMLPWLQDQYGNPSSSHLWGAEARQRLEQARRETSILLDCKPAEVIFTSGGTEANNLAIRGAALARQPRDGHIVTTAIEHPAVLQVLAGLQEECGYTYTMVPVDRMGMVAPADILAALTDRTVLVTVMHANNEVGTIQPIAKIAASLGEREILLHTDAAQSAGKIPVDAPTLGADLISLAGHKIYGPKGVGALFIKAGTKVKSVLRGAGQERGIKPGTESVMLSAGFGRACKLAAAGLAAGAGEKMATLRDHLARELMAALPDAKVHGAAAPRLPNTLSLAIPGILVPDLIMELGHLVAFSAGAACHEDTTEISHVLAAMGVAENLALGTLRISVGQHTTKEEITRAVEIIAPAAIRLGAGGRN